MTVTALPQVDPKRLQLRSLRSVTSDLVGQYKSAFRGSGLVFSDLREYQPGDDVKHIHWRATARSGTTYVKNYDEDRQLSVVLLVDLSSSLVAGVGRNSYGRALEFSALVTSLTLRGSDLLGLLSFADAPLTYLPPKTGITHYRRVISALVRSPEVDRGTDIAAALRHLRASLKRRSLVFVLSDFLAPPFDVELRLLSQRHDVVLVFIDQPGVREIPHAGLVALRDSETGERRVFDTSSKKVRDELQRQLALRYPKVEATARKCGADSIRIVDRALEPLARLMRERSLRQGR
jgi:uncharacterized protein (DUF58 family)